jgi:isopenicillin-N epimerase
VVVSNHGYLTAGWSAEARGATLRTATFAVDADPADVVAAFAAAVTDRTRLVVIDQLTSPTALELPVAAVAAAVAPVPVLVDAAHVPGALPGLDVEGLGVAFWAGNLHKWAYTPRAAATLWVAPEHREAMRPLVTSWSHGLPYPERFDLQGTVDHSSWVAVPDGLAAWRALGGWAQVERNADLLVRGAEHVRSALGTPDPRAGIRSAPCLRLVALPDGVATTTESAEALWQQLYAAGLVVPPVSFEGRGYLRLAAAPYNDEDDYARLAAALPGILGA